MRHGNQLTLGEEARISPERRQGLIKRPRTGYFIFRRCWFFERMPNLLLTQHHHSYHLHDKYTNPQSLDGFQ